jgi:hypothetical protein
MMGCKKCKNYKFCMERSRNYPCREYTNVKATSKPNNKGVKENVINYTRKNDTSKMSV